MASGAWQRVAKTYAKFFTQNSLYISQVVLLHYTIESTHTILPFHIATVCCIHDTVAASLLHGIDSLHAPRYG
jgi:hypothetical protein